MKTFLEYITKQELDRLEIKLDSIWSSLGIDIEFALHFFERLNDKRNRPEIMLKEVEAIFIKAFQKYGKQLKDASVSLTTQELEGILKDINSNINIPIIFRWSRRTKKLELYSKTIMRKKNFKSSDVELKV